MKNPFQDRSAGQLVILLVVVVVATVMVASEVLGAPINQTEIINATWGDSYTYIGNTEVNYGTQQYVYVRGYNSHDNWGYFLVNLSEWKNTHSIVQLFNFSLSLYEYGGWGDSINNTVYYCNDDFNESNITWANQDTEVTNCVRIGAEYSFPAWDGTAKWKNVTNSTLTKKIMEELIIGDGIFTIKINTYAGGSSNHGSQYRSKEYTDTTYRPYVNLTYDEGYSYISTTYNNETLEGSNENFLGYVQYNSSLVSSISAVLNYTLENGTSLTYIASSSHNSTHYIFNKTIAVPLINSGNSDVNNASWIFTINYIDGNSTTYQSEKVSQTVWKMSFSATSSSYPVYNITSYKNEETGATISPVTNAWSATVYNPDNPSWTRQYSGSSGAALHTFYALWANENYSFKVDATMKLSATGYTTRYHSLAGYIANGTKTSVTLYLLNSSSSNKQTITINVIDQNSDPLIDAEVKIYREYTGYILSCDTDVNGNCVVDLDVSARYKFVVYYNGEQVYDSGYMSITSTTLSLQVNLEDYNIIDIIDAFKEMEHSLNYDNGTFTLTYEDGDGIASQVCLQVDKVNLTNETTTIGTNCSSESSGTLTITLTETSGQFVAIAYGYSAENGNKYIIEILSQDNREFEDIFGKEMGLFVAFIVVGTIAFLGLFNPIAAVIFGLVALIGATLIGLVNISYAAIIGLIVAGIIIIIKLRT